MGTLIVQLQGEYESFPAPSAAGDKEEEDWYVCWHGCKCSQNRKDRCWIDSLLPTHPDRAVCWATFLLHCSRSHALMPKTQSIHPTQTLTAKPVCAHCWRSFLVFAWSGDCPAPFWLYSACSLLAGHPWGNHPSSHTLLIAQFYSAKGLAVQSILTRKNSNSFDLLSPQPGMHFGVHAEYPCFLLLYPRQFYSQGSICTHRNATQSILPKKDP